MRIKIIFIPVILVTFNITFLYSQHVNKTRAVVNFTNTSNNEISSLKLSLEELKNKQSQNERLFAFIEKTNNQLSLWWNPYGVMIASLGVLFTILAIVVTIILFRQSANYRKTIDKAIIEYREIINKFLEEKKIEIDTTLKTLEEKMNSSTTERKKEIQGVIDSLKRQKGFLDTATSFPMSSSMYKVHSFYNPLAEHNINYINEMYSTAHINALVEALGTKKNGKDSSNDK